MSLERSPAAPEWSARQRARLWGDLWCDALAGAFIVAALLVALRTTRDLRGPHDPDHFRDIAQAQTVRDGHPLTDPYYRDEWAWYNPLLAWTVAAGSAIIGETVEEFHVHGGPWLNLLGPVAFYLLALRLTGRRAALAALTIYLFFITGNEHSWAAATYSPWLFSDNFSSGLFFATATVMVWTGERPGVGRAIASGLLIGLTFLAHTAPAVILALVACGLWWRQRQTLALAGGAALVVSAPFLTGLVLAYHLHVVHAVPLTYQYAPISRDGFFQTLQRYSVIIAASSGGLWAARSRFIWAWLAVSVLLTLYAIAPLQPMVPAFHFWLYATAAFSLLCGALVARLVANPYLLGIGAVALVTWHWHAYATRQDIQVGRFLAARRSVDHIAAARFLRTITTADDIVLGSAGVVRFIIGPAGRKTVAPDPYFANPYVEYDSRQRDRDAMLAAIERQDLAVLAPLARARDVSAAVMTDASHCVAATRMFPLTWSLAGDTCISIVRDHREGRDGR